MPPECFQRDVLSRLFPNALASTSGGAWTWCQLETDGQMSMLQLSAVGIASKSSAEGLQSVFPRSLGLGSVLWVVSCLVALALFSVSSGKGGTEVGTREIKSGVRRWPLILAASAVQMVSGSVYAMGAWQDELRDVLGASMSQVSTISAMTFTGSVVAFMGGQIFDHLGPRTAVLVGALAIGVGYLLIALAIAVGNSAPMDVRLALAAVGSMLAGYSSVSLLDNIVCMACSLSFPAERAAVVGCLKAVLATSAGLWAIVWVHVFRAPGGLGLVPFLVLLAVVSVGICLLAAIPMEVLPQGPARNPFNRSDFMKLGIVISCIVAISSFDVAASYLFATGILSVTPSLPLIGVGLSVLPLIVLALPSWNISENDVGTASLGGVEEAAASNEEQGDDVTFLQSVVQPDYWLLLILQFAVFGAGVATNQNMALIFESVGKTETVSLAVAIFALASSLSRMSVGILSDRYIHLLSRMQWLIIVATLAVIGQVLLSTMQYTMIMLGVVLAGLSFGMFFTLIVPVVNEMYGKRNFGVILGSQLGCQALASIAFCKVLLPTVYRRAAGGNSCLGPNCFRWSFVTLAIVNFVGLVASAQLERRNKNSTPRSRNVGP